MPSLNRWNRQHPSAIIPDLFGSRFEKKAQIAGGVILVLLGVKILLEHLGMIG